MRGFRSFSRWLNQITSPQIRPALVHNLYAVPGFFNPCNPRSVSGVNPSSSWVSTPKNPSWVCRNLSYGSVNLVISDNGKPRFATHEIDPPKKEKWKTKKRLKLQRKREKEKRRAANKRDPRRLTVKGKKRKQKFANAEERITYKLEKARIKEALLLERLKKYEVLKLQGPVVKPYPLTGEERFYLKKMAQKGSNYVPVGRRGVFGGVILNMHMHWKKHETVKVFFKHCKPGQLQEYALEIARLSGGVPIQMIGDDTVIFYRGKNYVQPVPEVMSPIDTLSKKRALEKSKYEQSLETVRHFIAVSEKELELYRQHISLYGEPKKRNYDTVIDHSRENMADSVKTQNKNHRLAGDLGFPGKEYSSTDEDEPADSENEFEDHLSSSGLDEDGGGSEYCED
ncbi:hypothetical protein Dimus_026290 [Dionaea muscipula]